MYEQPIDLVVLDMAGTTLKDAGEVEACFAQAIREENVAVSAAWIKAVQGWAKRAAFVRLWEEKLGPEHPELLTRVDQSYARFRRILESYYETTPVEPTEGCLETFAWLRQRGIKIALTTGFYRKVANVILEKLGWLAGLDSNYQALTPDAVIDLSLTSTEVERGRPAPDMIHMAMQRLGVQDPQRVIKIGDTPSDIEAGLNAGVRMSLGLTNGTHSHEQLAACQPDGLLSNLGQLPKYLLGILAVAYETTL